MKNFETCKMFTTCFYIIMYMVQSVEYTEGAKNVNT